MYDDFSTYIKKIGGEIDEREVVNIDDSVDITQLEYIPRVDVKYLSVSTPKMKGHFSYFKNLNLQSLAIRETDLSSEDIQTIANFENLKELRIVSRFLKEKTGHVLSKKDVSVLSKLKKIKNATFELEEDDLALFEFLDILFLSISGNVECRGLSKFTELERLYIYESHFSNESAKELKGLIKLKDIAIYESKLTDDGVLEILGNSKLRGVSFDENNISEKGLEGLADLKQLSSLSIKNCGMQIENLFDILAQCPQLRYLDISGNNFTENAHQKIKQLAKLENLYQLVMSRKDVPLRKLRDIKNTLPNVSSFDF
ncbi:MAG: hypothetical protein HRT89_10125 [Lentisphaeria bacterium]|nr:protein phosphatase 1 regulatory subunit 42 [Lentisphaeria bacterium]NQZ68417.1 hypothetical protein [Lentisphaeria bacterium]